MKPGAEKQRCSIHTSHQVILVIPENLFDVAKIYQQRCFEKSGQRLENVDQPHLLLASQYDKRAMKPEPPSTDDVFLHSATFNQALVFGVNAHPQMKVLLIVRFQLRDSFKSSNDLEARQITPLFTTLQSATLSLSLSLSLSFMLTHAHAHKHILSSFSKHSPQKHFFSVKSERLR